VELDADGFTRHVSASDIPVLVDFWAPWCQPCLMMAPEFQQAAAQLEPRIRLAKLNTESTPAPGQQLGIRSIPTLVLFQNGRERARHSGALMAGDIVRWVVEQSR
jgi:thioredoxin 2